MPLKKLKLQICINLSKLNKLKTSVLTSMNYTLLPLTKEGLQAGLIFRVL